jgi:hypothetical protein
MAAMVVGARGRNATRIIDAFERMRVIVVPIDAVQTACDRLAVEMPHVVLVATSLRDDERDALSDRATAVGALVVNVDPELDDETFADFIERTVQAVIERKLRNESAEAEANGAHEHVSPDELDEGWDE